MEESKNLKVRVISNGEEKVMVTMPIYSLSIIDTLVPENVIKILKNKNIDLKEIIEQVKETRYKPQTLFKEEAEVDGIQKKYHVWIE